MINDPNVRILLAQNTMSNAKKKVSAVKLQWETNGLLRALFPELLPDGSRPWSAEGITLNRSSPEPECTLEPAGTGTAVTSRHYDDIIEDDTVAPDFDSMTGEIQQPTLVEIEKAIGFHKMCYPLMVDQERSVRTIIGTRWDNNDLLAYIMKYEPEYTVYTRSVLENAGGASASYDQGGRPIWPEKFGEASIARLERSLGRIMFDMLYMNSPSSSINQVFKRDYIRYYEEPPSSLLYCTTIDPAPSEVDKKSDPDYNAVVTTAIEPKTGHVYVVHYDFARMDPGKLIDIIFSHYVAYHPVCVRVESVAYQKTLCYWIRQRQQAESKLFHIEEVTNARVSKNARIMALEPWFSSLRVRIHSFHSDLERQLLAFDPHREALDHDDLIDALAMHVDFWSRCTEAAKDEDDAAKLVGTFDGKAVVQELLDRANVTRRYPYDIGHMADRLAGSQLRDDYMPNCEEVFV